MLLDRPLVERLGVAVAALIRTKITLMRNLTATFCLTIAVLLSAPSKAASILYNCDFPS